MSDINLEILVTEKRNENTKKIDSVTTVEMLKLINNEDKAVPLAVEKELNKISDAVDLISSKIKEGGRFIYCGAGTSGRLGVLDASECLPTYGVGDDVIVALIAGGRDAMFKAKEGAEDSKELCVKDLKDIEFTNKDVFVGIAASGRTPYVIGGLEYAGSIGASTISISCNPNSPMAKISDISIAPVVGPEVVTGSTRMKAGTAQKLVLNMISTGVMIKMGKVYGNLMVDVNPSNEKLVERAKRIVMQATDVSREKAEEILKETNYNVKLSIMMIISNLDKEKAEELLLLNSGYIAKAIESLK
ncbi:N-acetylmuramic acid 6-phosphate etherase [Clostridium sp. 'White wine YQ']|uniref:N-acetylmuramic acid 6-phosphate etherase n=1 Tax=Clostridium sp. 'White wine YQ' TaxID=3027474 RepID=UPI00236531F0|nr:N-acetylmuramic acid 6-phosphate etherase [Clostridium sp. 'White wine YQ']MDD7795649.1 N-acetylmuramic acid 6-phosphate etherase [Clostridium sp. 'White wine YQ']